MNIRIRPLLGAVLVVASGGAAAEEAAPAAGPFQEGWYVAPMITHMAPDSARCNVDGDFGATAVVGHRGEAASIEVWAQMLTLSHGTCTYLVPGPSTPDPNDDERVPATEPSGDLKLNGGGIALLVGPFSDQAILSRLYGLVGIGVLKREGQPRYADDASTIIGDLGAGYVHPLRLWEHDLLLRLEARYRYDVQPPPHPDEQDPNPAHTFNDVLVNLGLQVPLSHAEEPPAPAPAPAAVVPVADTDNDGVNDDRDQCPDTPPGSYVSNVGCPAPLVEPVATPEPDSEPVLETAKAGDTIVLKGVTFESGKARLRADSETILDGVAETLLKRPELRVEVGGHTDDRGADAYNQSLSQQRAEAVQAYLVGRGVEASRLSAVGYGETHPVQGNDTSEGRERNRRVELKVLEQEQQPPQSNTGEAS